jgi:hypothetical protein
MMQAQGRQTSMQLLEEFLTLRYKGNRHHVTNANITEQEFCLLGYITI